MEAKDLTLRKRPIDGHKGTFGHALLVVGSELMAGATVLSAKACLRSGVGKVSVDCYHTNIPVVHASVPEAIIHPCGSTIAYSAVGVGPGLSQSEHAVKVVSSLLVGTHVPAVFDADALNIIASRNMHAQLPYHAIITPHEAEFDRLFGMHSSREQRIKTALTRARSYNIYIVLKGHNTVVVAPDGTIDTCLAGNSGMATAGSGDVLTGLITGLLAQGYTPFEAARLGVWLHATAGDVAAQELTEECVTASDIIAYLPQVFKQLKHETK